MLLNFDNERSLFSLVSCNSREAAAINVKKKGVV